MRYGLIGEKLGHSYSKIIHERIINEPYDLIPLDNEEFDKFMRKKEFAGINVTIPYKQKVIAYLDELDPLAKKIGAVNTVVNKNGRLTGYNTDFYGLKYLFNRNNISVNQKKCLILGNGGTSQTARTVLETLGAKEILTVSRNPAGGVISYEDCRQNHTDAEIIVNTTPVGMYPNMDASPLDLTPFKSCIAVVDVIFNPLKTKLAQQAESLGIKAVTGLVMLVAQAKQAQEHFRGIKLDDDIIETITEELLKHLGYENV
ncbi:shikimate dehydrogenase [Herbinix hemicellulosilytica]|uniref:Shikimate dehydrogenase substrate binding N-terminal domain-containing protein n=1 Tax=Herbinix hemicellulosilytica TaxID=1564487 RepID=A0A0H5SE44_HERHM|nr:shikimate dehydrogenase [Herbinix hemicellulosilytica]RBP57582.1 shikimate dehydrogenase [Herbinix hemicellulosilytica]CRZ33674.1 hypothetical protein HHT355_0469 [Herbinix hemicellulosilytica]HPU63593.1 shikimate dehydrogenase [Mobilitalea sp.]